MPDNEDKLSLIPLPWSLGLKGFTANVANLTAVALVCVLFYQGHQEFLKQAREDRVMFREELATLHKSSQRQWQELRSLTESVRALAEDVRNLKSRDEENDAKKPDPLPDR